jgi:hypothetical protein
MRLIKNKIIYRKKFSGETEFLLSTMRGLNQIYFPIVFFIRLVIMISILV